MDQDPDGAALLEPLRALEPDSPTTVSVARAIRTANRHRQVRRVAGSVAAAVLTAVVVIAASALGQRDLPPAQPPGQFDVLRQAFTVGSAGGFTPASYETGRHRQVVRLRPAPDSPQGTPESATVTLYARGRAPQPVGERAPDVHGRRAYFTSAAQTEIAWEWADDSWAFAVVSASGPDARTLAHRVAQSVATGADVLVRVPFTVPTPADGTQLLGVITPYGTASDPAAGALLVLGGRDERVLVGVRRRLDHDFVSGKPRAAPDTAATIPDVGDGWSAVAEADGSSPGHDRLAELAASVQLSSEPTTPLR